MGTIKQLWRTAHCFCQTPRGRVFTELRKVNISLKYSIKKKPSKYKKLRHWKFNPKMTTSFYIKTILEAHNGTGDTLLSSSLFKPLHIMSLTQQCIWGEEHLLLKNKGFWMIFLLHTQWAAVSWVDKDFKIKIRKRPLVQAFRFPCHQAFCPGCTAWCSSKGWPRRRHHIMGLLWSETQPAVSPCFLHGKEEEWNSFSQKTLL